MGANMDSNDWKDEYNVNHEIIDAQHKKLFDMINDLKKAIDAKSGSDVIDSIMKEMSDYTFYHFSFEESYMEQIRFPQLAEHKEYHENLKKRLYDIFNQFYTDQNTSCCEVLQFLENWWKKHILEKDRCYYEFIESVRK